ncbi:hypothetical protein RSOLAG1IB_11613 [Rhizoctonia solani AG-1 IB]|uniref:G domain-containing protein n=1 Tax=Thanatephorus cucumeris (strain AG1-IB / isolate 7/3/14) TaxID=1108050 RepID=A0A0B7F9K4_THACB|nr:hypothetical protein RSOLAG1IB_11613 [Rhizoctonia solani AG-1 IB]
MSKKQESTKAPIQRDNTAPDDSEDNPHDNSNVKYILVLGPRGSGKTKFINTAPYRSARARRDEGKGYEPCTKLFYTCQKFSMHGQEFAFIDSPGFDSKVMCDEEIFLKAMGHLGSRSGEPMKLTGVVYVHPQEANLGSRALWRNLGMLMGLIGEANGGHVSALIRPRSEKMDDGRAISSTIVGTASPFSIVYRRSQLKTPISRIWTFQSWTQSTLSKVLQPYTTLTPIQLRIQFKDSSREQLVLQLRKFLPSQYAKNCSCPDEFYHCPGPTPDNLEKGADVPTTNQNKEELGANIEPGLKEQQLSSINEPKKKEPTEQDDVEQLKEQLKRTQSDYASLHSHLQVQDNTVESEITKALTDVNHIIEAIGNSVSEYVNETQPEPNLLGALGDHSQLKEFFKGFAHAEGSSLIHSPTGACMAPQDFFDYAVRATLCHQLCEKLFKPFHPSLNEEGNSIIEIYNQIAYHDAQPVAGRWRRDAFKAIERSLSSKTKQTSSSIHQNLVESLDTLLKICSRSPAELQLSPEQKTEITKLGNKAEELNQLVKGTVVYLGDYQPTMYMCGDAFQASHMSELQTGPKPKKDHPPAILATVTLGLVKKCAVGGGRSPEETVVCTAAVVSERVCTFL